MTQIVTRVSEGLARAIDELVAEGMFANRSDAVRAGLERVLAEHRRQVAGRRIAEAYARQPLSEDEITGLQGATRALVEEEPW